MSYLSAVVQGTAMAMEGKTKDSNVDDKLGKRVSTMVGAMVSRDIQTDQSWRD